jgi:hypothetical protein
MKEKSLIVSLVAIFGGLIGFQACASQKFVEDRILIGRSSSADQTIEFKNGPKIKANDSLNKLQLSNDGTTYYNPLSETLASGKIYVGNGSSVATPVDLSADATLANTGAVTVNSVGGSSAANINAAELLANAATSANTANAIVKRGASGEFSAGSVTTTTVNAGNISATANTISSTDVNGNVTVTPNGTGKVVLNGSGVTHAATGEIAGATQLDVDNLRLNGNTVSATDTNGHLNLVANGTGKVKIGAAALEMPNSDGSSGQLLSTNGSGVLTFTASATGGFTEYGTLKFDVDTTPCDFTTASSSYSDFSANAGCVSPSVTGGATANGKTPSVILTNAPAGTYRVTLSGWKFYNNSGSDVCAFAMSTTGTTADMSFAMGEFGANGTQNISRGVAVGSFTLGSTTTVTIRIIAKRTSGTTSSCRVGLEQFSIARIIVDKY